MINFTIYGGLVQLSGNTIEIDVTNDDVKGESPRALLKAISVDGDVQGGPFIDSRPWTIQQDASGKCTFDFSEYLNASTNFNFTFPYSTDFAVKHPLRSFDIKILAGASYIDNDITHFTPDVPETNTYGTKIETWQAEANAVSIRILKGGISQDRQAQYNEAGTNFYQDYVQGNKFLTNRPDNQRISYNQPVRLWYLLPGSEPITRALYVIYTLPDDTQTAVMRQVTLEPDGLYEFIFDPIAWNLPENTVKFSVIQLEHQPDSMAVYMVGESRTFIIDQKYSENNTFLFFANSKAGIDDVWFTGAVKLGNTIEGETGIQSTDRNATTRDRSVVVTGKTGSRKWSIFPGNRFSISDMEYLQDMLYSKLIWLVWKNKIIPVNLENGDFELTDTMRDLLINDELELVFVEGHKNNYY